jgi:hypothetical protein
MLSVDHANRRWLAINGVPRVWVALSELLSSPTAPAAPFDEWTDTQVLGAMFQAIERRAGIDEVPHCFPN